MRILAASDIHGDIDVARNLSKIATENNVDLVVLAGDLTLSDEWTSGVFDEFKKNGHNLLIMSGNHDSPATVDFLSKMYGAKNIDDGYHVHGNIGFFGKGGANIGPFAMEEEEIFDRIKKNHEAVKDAEKKIMITHVHPSGTNAEKMTNIFPGSQGVRRAIEEIQPDIFICGHVHEAEGLEEQIGKTKIYNVGEKGKIIDI